ncbi:hypothetical protein KO465_06820 [Candidatus Micrarchaeota archaeon]|nr:hypothetical protein [Candidatus Micrarchaeota archaeon]
MIIYIREDNMKEDVSLINLASDKRAEFLMLFEEFVGSYLLSPNGERHSAYYDEGRRQARSNLAKLIESRERGEDITEDALSKLLPYIDTPANRKREFWVSSAGVFMTDARKRLEAAGIVRQEDWPQVALSIFNFVRYCNEKPDQLLQACNNFAASPYSKGFQAGTLTPILNALHSDKFVIFNKKSRLVLNYFTGTSYTQSLIDYPEANSAALILVEYLANDLQKMSGGKMLAVDLFDMFSHWLVAVKNYLPPLFKAKSKVGDKKIEAIVSVPEAEEGEDAMQCEDASVIETATSTDHTQIQYLLLTLGAEMGLNVWVARNDRSRSYQGQTLGTLPHISQELPTQFNPATQRTIELIDVLWLKGNSIVSAFEVESTTSIYSGLLRMSDLLALQPNLDIKIYLVASYERRDKVKQEIIRPTFQLRERPLNRVCGYLSLEDLIEKVDVLRKHGLIKSLNPDFLTNIAEYFGGTDG